MRFWIFWLGWKAVWRERILLIFCGAALAAVLGPLLLIYGFKFGLISALLGELESNATTRQIVLQGDYSLVPAKIAEFGKLPHVAFVEPVSRTLAARLELQQAGKQDSGVTASLSPTGPADPLLPANIAIGTDEVALSFSLAERLQVKAGDEVRGMKHRNGANGEEEFVANLQVKYVIPRGLSIGDIAYMPPAFLEQVEQFSDGYEVPALRLPGKPAASRVTTYANIRLYASTIDDVKGVVKDLEGLGYNVSSRADEVEQVIGLNRSLAAVFTLVAAVGAVGYAVSLAASLAAAIAQKRKLLSLLRLMGARKYALLFFPLAQGLAIATVGFLMAAGVYWMVASVANQRFAGALPGQKDICHLTIGHFAFAAAATGLMVLLVIGLVSRPLTNLAPAQVLHED